MPISIIILNNNITVCVRQYILWIAPRDPIKAFFKREKVYRYVDLTQAIKTPYRAILRQVKGTQHTHVQEKQRKTPKKSTKKKKGEKKKTPNIVIYSIEREEKKEKYIEYEPRGRSYITS